MFVTTGTPLAVDTVLTALMYPKPDAVLPFGNRVCVAWKFELTGLFQNERLNTFVNSARIFSVARSLSLQVRPRFMFS